MDDLERALAFEEDLRHRAADRVEPFRFGHAVFTESLPRVWDLNLLRVERGVPATADELASEADRLLGGAGLAHRRISILDERLGEEIAPDFRSLGWRADRFAYMARRRSPEREVDVGLASEVPWEANEALRAVIARGEPWAEDDEVVRQLWEANGRVARAGHGRHFAVLVHAEVVASADLYSDGATAQVEDVATLPEHRGRGYASAVVQRAVAEAEATGHDLVFLIADAEDWPKKLYRRLGFDELGRKSAFNKPPPGTPAS